MKSGKRNVPASIHARRREFESSCSVDGGPDGLRFDGSQLVLEEISRRNRYHGMRIRVPVTLGHAGVVLQIDMGFGDAVYPEPTNLTIEPLLDLEAPRVLAYPLEAVVAEKLEAMVSIGVLTSRMKDLYGIYAIASARVFDRAHSVCLVSASEGFYCSVDMGGISNAMVPHLESTL